MKVNGKEYRIEWFGNQAAGYTQTGKELADLVAQKIMQKKAENAEMKGTIHETLFGKTADADS